MSTPFRVIVAILSLLGSTIGFFAALDNERWQCYLASSFFFSIFLAVITPVKIARFFGFYIALILVLICAFILYDSMGEGWEGLLKALRFSLVYGTPALAYLIYQRSPFSRKSK